MAERMKTRKDKRSSIGFKEELFCLRVLKICKDMSTKVSGTRTTSKETQISRSDIARARYSQPPSLAKYRLFCIHTGINRLDK